MVQEWQIFGRSTNMKTKGLESLKSDWNEEYHFQILVQLANLMLGVLSVNMFFILLPQDESITQRKHVKSKLEKGQVFPTNSSWKSNFVCFSSNIILELVLSMNMLQINLGFEFSITTWCRKDAYLQSMDGNSCAHVQVMVLNGRTSLKHSNPFICV